MSVFYGDNFRRIHHRTHLVLRTRQKRHINGKVTMLKRGRNYNVTRVQGRITILADNYMGEDEVYLVTVFTGDGFGSGTTANVCIELNGTENSSRVSTYRHFRNELFLVFFSQYKYARNYKIMTTILSKAHWLYSTHYRTLQRSGDDWFIICTPQSLGELQSVRVWHDNYGSSPDWYCKRIVVTEVRTEKIWTLEFERWFSLYRPVDRIEYVVHVAPTKRKWRDATKEYVGMKMREKHMWASVIIR